MFRYPDLPIWRDIENVWDSKAHLQSSPFESSLGAEFAREAHETVKDLGDEYFEVPSAIPERRELVHSYVLQVAGSVTSTTPRTDNMTIVYGLYGDVFRETISSMYRRAIRDVQEAERLAVSDGFDFPKFMRDYIEEFARYLIRKYQESQWIRFYDEWDGDVSSAQMALTEEHKRRIGNPEIWLFPHQIEVMIAGHVQSVENSVRMAGGNIGNLFPWPVR